MSWNSECSKRQWRRCSSPPFLFQPNHCTNNVQCSELSWLLEPSSSQCSKMPSLNMGVCMCRRNVQQYAITTFFHDIIVIISYHNFLSFTEVLPMSWKCACEPFLWITILNMWQSYFWLYEYWPLTQLNFDLDFYFFFWPIRFTLMNGIVCNNSYFRSFR